MQRLNHIFISLVAAFGVSAYADQDYSFDDDQNLHEYVVTPSGNQPAGFEMVIDDEKTHHNEAHVLYSVWKAAGGREVPKTVAVNNEDRLPLSNLKDSLEGYGERIQAALPENFTVDAGDINPRALSLAYEWRTGNIGTLQFLVTGDVSENLAEGAKNLSKKTGLRGEQKLDFEDSGFGVKFVVDM